MNRIILVALAGIVSAGANASTQQASPRPAAPAPPLAASHATATLSAKSQNELVARYCATCHSQRGKAGGLTLTGFDAARLGDNGDVAEKMIRKLRSGMMPPPGAARPDAPTLASMVHALESAMDAQAALNPRPGWRPFQRLNRVEYAAAVRDLLGLDIDVNAYLPPDTMSGGFDNVADTQVFSPQLMQGYLRAASQISRLAVGDRNASATSATYKIPHSRSQMAHVPGAPIGTRGGTSVVHVFPADGDYVIKIAMQYASLGGLFGRTPLMTMGFREQVDVSLNGERVATLDVSPTMTETDFGQNKGQNGMELRTPPLHIPAGQHRVTAAFIRRLDGPVDDLIAPIDNTAEAGDSYGSTTLPHMRDMTIIGPTSVTGVSDTVSRRRIFTCRPTSANQEEACATQIVKDLTTRAYRGRGEAQGIQQAMQFYAKGRASGDFENGIRMALQSILVSPLFVFRFEGGAGVTPTAAGTYHLTGDDLASRLSFFLWGTSPDAELLRAADSGLLRTAAGLDKQVRRMLADARAEALSTRFASQWLRLQDLDKLLPDFNAYPQFDDTLKDAMRRETLLFFDSIVRDDRSVLDLLTADYSFVNDRLARHYGIPNVTGSAFRRVTLPDYRRGLLGEGSILTLTSVADRTSPVLRGKWVMEVLLASPPPPPPPNVPAFDETKGVSEARLLSVRERMKQHRANPQCNSCHRVIDPIGLALENFDVTGAWRIKDSGVPIDPSGTLYDGSPISGPIGLRQALLKRSDVVVTSFVQSLMTYAIGRRVEFYDMPAIRAIARDAAKNENRMSSFILGVVNSRAFQMSRADAAETETDSRVLARP